MGDSFISTTHYPLSTMPRRGFTLIEMLVVLTIGSVVFGITVGMLHLLLRSERTGRERVHRAAVSARLAEQFRSDTAAAIRHEPVEEDNQQALCQFVLPGDRTVTYRAMPAEVRREERIAEKPVRQESYSLPDGCSVAVAVEGEADPPLASLVVTCDHAPPSAGRAMRVTALLGKDHRFSQRSAEDE